MVYSGIQNFSHLATSCYRFLSKSQNSGLSLVRWGKFTAWYLRNNLRVKHHPSLWLLTHKWPHLGALTMTWTFSNDSGKILGTGRVDFGIHSGPLIVSCELRNKQGFLPCYSIFNHVGSEFDVTGRVRTTQTWGRINIHFGSSQNILPEVLDPLWWPISFYCFKWQFFGLVKQTVKYLF